MQKAVLAFKNLVEHRKKQIVGFRDKNQPWNANPDLPSEMAEGLAEFLSDEVEHLEKIIKLLEGKPTKCKHPKKDHDRCDGVLYCMNCNADL